MRETGTRSCFKFHTVFFLMKGLDRQVSIGKHCSLNNVFKIILIARAKNTAYSRNSQFGISSGLYDLAGRHQ